MEPAKKAGGRPNRKDEILAATEKLLRSRGLSGTTTRQIAETVGCSEGAIYVHFGGRVELFLAVLERSLPEMLKPLHALRDAVGLETPEHNLEIAVRGIFAFHRRVTPMLSSLFAEPELLEAYRKSLARGAKGPQRAIGNVAEYIRAEQAAGRVAKSVDAEMAATLLMSASFFRAFSDRFFGPPGGGEEFFHQLIATVLR
jgi:AcrR family transcriptional regulator